MQRKACSVCLQELERSHFPSKGSICLEDNLALESLQGILKRCWKRDYQVKYKELKKDKEKWRRQILAHKINNGMRQKRQLAADFEQVVQKQVAASGKGRRKKFKKLTFEALKARMAKPEYGGFSEEQALARWKELQTSGAESDMRGIVAGVPGHKRFKIELSSTDSEHEREEQQREFLRGKKPKREMDVGEVADFLQGMLAKPCFLSWVWPRLGSFGLLSL